MLRKKLTIEEQICDMKEKGITFELANEEDAIAFLKYSNYYFKLKSYGRNYEKYRATEKKGQYVHLDFACLKELSILDMHLRTLILNLALNVEHALKTQLMYNLSKNSAENGYQIVQKYLEQDYMREKSINDKINKSASSDLILKHHEKSQPFALWEIVEVLSFGEFMELYRLYYTVYPSADDYSNYLGSIKFLRNAAAHNNCLLNSIRAPYNIKLHKTESFARELSKIKGLSETSRNKWLKNPVIHDFLVLVYMFLRITKSKAIKCHGIEEISLLFNERMLRHKDYFIGNNDSLVSSYQFTQRVLKYFINKYRK